VKTRIPKRFGLNPIRDIQVLCLACTRFRRHRVRCFMEREVSHGETKVYAGVQA
jgi:hypothetical protein